MTDKLRDATHTSDPDPADIIAGALQTSRAHAYELMHKALAQQDAQEVPTQRQYEMALRQWDHWKSYALELQAKLVKYEGGSPMVLNTAPTPTAQRVALTEAQKTKAELWDLAVGKGLITIHSEQLAPGTWSAHLSVASWMDGHDKACDISNQAYDKAIQEKQS